MLLVLIILVVLCFGGFGGYYGNARWGGPGLGGGILIPILLVILVLWMLGVLPHGRF
jgi:hypothetical protein